MQELFVFRAIYRPPTWLAAQTASTNITSLCCTRNLWQY